MRSTGLRSALRSRPGTAVLSALVVAAGLTGCASDGAPDTAGSVTPEDVAAGLLPAVVFEGEDPVTYSLEARMAFYNVPGVSVAVLEDGEVAWARGWGMADTETGAPVTPETLFQAASISKPVGALAALSLVEEGRLDLDVPVNDHLTSWQVPDNEFTADSAVTLRGILTHSAGLTVWGFPGYRKDQPFSDDQAVATNVQVLDGEGNTGEVRVYKVPGTGWQYSGGGYTVMEQLVEDVAGEPFSAVTKARVLDPAGMVLSTYEQPLPQDRWAEAARGHRGDGSQVEGEWHSYPEQAAAGLWTTPKELLTLSAHLLRILDGEETAGVLSQDMLSAMLTPNHPGDDAYSNWGLGFALSGEGEGARFGHGGSNEGFKAQWTVFRNGGHGMAVMTNGDQGSALAAEIMRSAARIYGWPTDDYEPGLRGRTLLSTDVAQDFEGGYAPEGRPDFHIQVRAGQGGLVVAVPGQGESVIFAASDTEDEFFDPNDGSIFRFIRDDDGQVTGGENGSGTRFLRVSSE